MVKIVVFFPMSHVPRVSHEPQLGFLLIFLYSRLFCSDPIAAKSTEQKKSFHLNYTIWVIRRWHRRTPPVALSLCLGRQSWFDEVTSETVKSTKKMGKVCNRAAMQS